jgi:hypothetical protein
MRAQNGLSDAEQSRAGQLRLGEWLDSFLYFNDLWTWAHYRYLTTYYFANAFAFQWTARRTWPDYDFEPNFDDYRQLKQYSEKPGTPAFEHNLDRLRSVKDLFTPTPGGLRLKDNRIDLLERQIAENDIRAAEDNVLLAHVGLSPYYTAHLDPETRDAYEELYRRRAEVFSRHGYHVVRPRLEAEDFSDLVHLNPLGGRKLAEEAANAIRNFESRP